MTIQFSTTGLVVDGQGPVAILLGFIDAVLRGVGLSGFGREGGRAGLEKFIKIKSVSVAL